MPRSMKDARDAVLAEREQIAASIRELEDQLKELDGVLATLDRIGGAQGNGAQRAPRGSATRQSTGGASSNGRSAGSGRRGPRAGSMASRIESFLQGQGRKATHMDDIMTYLEQAGRAPGGKNPKGSLRTTLYQLEKSGRIRNIGKNRWRAGAARQGKAEATAA